MGSHKPGLSLPFDYKRRNKVVFSPMKTETHKKAIPKPVECLPDFGHFIPRPSVQDLNASFELK